MEGFYGSDWPIQAKAKRKEMSAADAHYIFVRELRYGKAYETSTIRIRMEECNQIAGFVHYRFTLEEEIPVLYVYEIQLESRYQGKGLGEFLMQLIELIASKVGSKMSLHFDVTCFYFQVHSLMMIIWLCFLFFFSESDECCRANCSNI